VSKKFGFKALAMFASLGMTAVLVGGCNPAEETPKAPPTPVPAVTPKTEEKKPGPPAAVPAPKTEEKKAEEKTPAPAPAPAPKKEEEAKKK
jgi:hypothetical protein